MIPSSETLILFISVSIVACLIPGPSVLFVISKTASGGIRTGLKSICGLQIGFFLQIIAATCGLSAVILNSSMLFKTIQLLGAFYLIYLGFSTILRKRNKENRNEITNTKGSHIVQGIFVDLLNPKITIFFISYLPQFIEADAPSPIGQLFFLGVIFSITGTATNIFYSYICHKTLGKFNEIHRNEIFKKWLPASVFTGLGIKLLFTKNG